MRPRLRRGIWISAVAVVAVAAVMLVAFGPTVRAQVRKQAERRGVDTSVESVHAGWGRVWLGNVSLQIPAVPAVSVVLDRVEVDLTATLGVEGIVVHGGTVVVAGSPEQVARQLSEWRAQQAQARGGNTVRYAAAGVRVLWRDAFSGAPEQHLWGGRYERRPDGSETLGADLARIRYGGIRLELHGPRVVLSQNEGRRALELITADAVFAGVALASLEDLATPSARRPAGHHRKASPVAAGAKPADQKGAVQRGPRLRRQLQRVASALQAVLPPRGELDLSGLKLELRHAAQLLRFGPGRLRLRRSDRKLTLSLVPSSQPQRTPLTLQLAVPLGAGPVELALQGGPVSLAALGVHEGDMGLYDVSRTQLQARGKLVLAADGRAVSFSGGGRLQPLSLEQEWLAPRPLQGISLAWEGKGEVTTDGSRLRIEEGRVDVGSVAVRVHGQLERSPEHWTARLHGGIPLASCQSMLDSVPQGLAPLLGGMKMSGTFALDAELELDTRRPADVKLGWDMRNECRVTAVPAGLNPRRFSQRWVRRVLGADGRELSVETGPGTADWVPLAGISPHLETAVIVCEDARFWRHRGFDQEAVANSIRDNLKAGRFVRGASTISMQLAKNLYLSSDKTVARKLAEAVLTLLLEQELTKSEILELYLNVIEFGPGIYGIGPAARYYFNSSAADLSLGQALYLASVLPNPHRHHFGPAGQVTPGWSEYLRRLMRIAFKINRISEAELEAGLSEQVTFGVPHAAQAGDGTDGRYAAEDEVDEAILGTPPLRQPQPGF